MWLVVAKVKQCHTYYIYVLTYTAQHYLCIHLCLYMYVCMYINKACEVRVVHLLESANGNLHIHTHSQNENRYFSWAHEALKLCGYL